MCIIIYNKIEVLFWSPKTTSDPIFDEIFVISFKLYAIDTKAEQAVVIDFDTNEILFEKNSNTKDIPASMTKIMTVYVAFDRIVNSNLYAETSLKKDEKI